MLSISPNDLFYRVKHPIHHIRDAKPEFMFVRFKALCYVRSTEGYSYQYVHMQYEHLSIA